MASLAEALCDARAKGAVIVVDPAQRPASVAAAYGIQAEAIARSGLRQVGWKIGAAAQSAMDLLAIDAPFLAPVLAPHCLADGARSRWWRARARVSRPSSCWRSAPICRRATEAYERDEVAAAIDYVAPAFEIVASRFRAASREMVCWRLPMAAAMPRSCRARRCATGGGSISPAHKLRLSINGAETASGSGSALIFGDPIAALAWLASQPQVAPQGLRRGEIVMTGTCTGLDAAQGGRSRLGRFR